MFRDCTNANTMLTMFRFSCSTSRFKAIRWILLMLISTIGTALKRNSSLANHFVNYSTCRNCVEQWAYENFFFLNYNPMRCVFQRVSHKHVHYVSLHFYINRHEFIGTFEIVRFPLHRECLQSNTLKMK